MKQCSYEYSCETTISQAVTIARYYHFLLLQNKGLKFITMVTAKKKDSYITGMTVSVYM